MAVYWKRGQQSHVIPLCAHCGSGGVSEVTIVIVIMLVMSLLWIADVLSIVLCTISLVLSKGLLS